MGCVQGPSGTGAYNNVDSVRTPSSDAVNLYLLFVEDAAGVTVRVAETEDKKLLQMGCVQGPSGTRPGRVGIRFCLVKASGAGGLTGGRLVCQGSCDNTEHRCENSEANGETHIEMLGERTQIKSSRLSRSSSYIFYLAPG